MSFCSKCGTEISEATRFCPNCGQAVNFEVSPSSKNEVVGSKLSAKEEIAKIYDYFSQRQDLYQKFDALTAKINGIPQRIKLFRFLLTGIFVVFVILAMMYENQKVLEEIMTVVLVAAIGGYLYYRFIKSRLTLKKLNAERDSVNSEILDYYNAYGDCSLGVEYTRIQDIQLIADVIRSGRATSIADALNLIIDDEHKARVERNTFEAAQNSAQAAQAAKSASKAAWINLFK
ncbi:MAG: zinc ribbon domain-containing protein [Treponema sp.]|nr:zinc ribbon domain-containing protein [Treponema sp.]